MFFGKAPQRKHVKHHHGVFRAKMHPGLPLEVHNNKLDSQITQQGRHHTYYIFVPHRRVGSGRVGWGGVETERVTVDTRKTRGNSPPWLVCDRVTVFIFSFLSETAVHQLEMYVDVNTYIHDKMSTNTTLYLPVYRKRRPRNNSLLVNAQPMWYNAILGANREKEQTKKMQNNKD